MPTSQNPHDFILFDLDGTLSDPLEGIGNCLNYALAHFGYPTKPLAELARYIGPPLDQSFIAETGSSDSAHIHALVAKYRERYGDVGYAENKLYPEIPAALAALQAAGIPMAVCTSKRGDFAEMIVQRFGLSDFFRFVNGAEIGTHKWQQIAALRERGIVTERSAMVGDRGVDLIAANRNGLTGVGVLWGYGSRAELAAEQPRHIFEMPAQLPQLADREHLHA